nr:MAG TPA_asm: hypothetical protein [Caudoviricetes sp.]
MRRDSLPCASLSSYGLLTRHPKMPAVIYRRSPPPIYRL